MSIFDQPFRKIDAGRSAGSFSDGLPHGDGGHRFQWSDETVPRRSVFRTRVRVGCTQCGRAWSGELTWAHAGGKSVAKEAVDEMREDVVRRIRAFVRANIPKEFVRCPKEQR